MAHLFTPDTSRQPHDWKLLRAGQGEVFSLPHGVIVRKPGGVNTSHLGGGCWYLMSPAGANVRVNGEPLFLGTRVMMHRDEIRIDGERFFFSTEQLASIEPLPELDHAVHCARCKQPAHTGKLAVRCPGCGAWYHQNGEYDCWSYDSKCSLCGMTTEIGGGYQWTPEQEGWS